MMPSFSLMFVIFMNPSASNTFANPGGKHITAQRRELLAHLDHFLWLKRTIRRDRFSGQHRLLKKAHLLRCAQLSRSNVLPKYVSARRFFARLASGTFLTSLRTGFFNTLKKGRFQAALDPELGEEAMEVVRKPSTG